MSAEEQPGEPLPPNEEYPLAPGGDEPRDPSLPAHLERDQVPDEDEAPEDGA
jgi:hypothetical protein